MADQTRVRTANCGQSAEPHKAKPADALGASTDRAAMLRLLERLVAVVHQPNPTDLSRWDVKPGSHRDFCRLIDDVCRMVVIANSSAHQ